AHRAFPWESEARGKAHVHVVIIGFGPTDVPAKFITDYDTDLEHPTCTRVANINPYLVEGSDTVLTKLSVPLCAVPEIVFGSMPNDGGHLLLNQAEKAELLEIEPKAEKFLLPFVGAEEFINGIERWCLWLAKATAAEIRAMSAVMRRIEAVKDHRLQSARATTRALAKQPTLFGENRQPASNYLLIPGVSSETRNYIPIGFLRPNIIASNAVSVVPDATLYHFAILTSTMHMAWVKHVCGRLESRFRYSNQIVYNNFPWPTAVTPAQREQLESAAKHILDLRVECGDGRHGYLPVRQKSAACTLADLYDPLTMPAALAKAHAALDRAVDRCYRKEAFASDRQRVEYLFQLYEQITAPLAPVGKPKRGGRRKKAEDAVPAFPPLLAQQVPNADQAAADAAHAYFLHEEPPPYRV
ncbi:MAG: type IIL restriction-modification enzyme MmeI, partial [Verrucomicrobiota bacterium]